jgi:DNA-binding transcriptional LysR family regulator
MAKTSDWDSRIGRRVTLRDLHTLFAVVEHGSMAKAGAHLGKSQSAVSQAIAAIEHAVGARLLDRTSRGVEPTTYGSVLLRRGRAAFDELRLGVDEIKCMADPTTGDVRIASSELVSGGVLPAIIDRLSLRYPRVKLQVFETTGMVMECPELKERKVDLRLGLLSRQLEGELAKEFDAEILCNDQICLAVGAASPWARRRKIDLAELVGEPWVAPSFAQPGGAAIMEAFHAVGLPPPQISVTATSLGLRNFLSMSGRFIVALPLSIVELYADRFALKRLPIEFPTEMSYAIITLKNRTLSPAVERFIKCAREVTKSKASREGSVPARIRSKAKRTVA